MIAIGMGLAWIGYATGFWGYCLIRGYNLSFMDVASPVHYYLGAKASRPGTWPPKCCPPGTVIPSKATIGKGVDCGGTNTAGSTQGQNPITSQSSALIQPGGSRSYINKNQAPYAK